MILESFFLYVFAITPLTSAVKVNMHGSLSLGKEVMDTISHYLREGYIPQTLNNRRLMDRNNDHITLEIQKAALCSDLKLCKEDMENFIKEYVATLVHNAEDVFAVADIMVDEAKTHSSRPFFGKLRPFLNDVHKILKSANEKISEDREARFWVEVIKKISAKWQKRVTFYSVDKLVTDTPEILKKLKQSIVINAALAEHEAQKKLCSQVQICFEFYEFTSTLNAMLERFSELYNDQVKSFMKSFYENLSKFPFYEKLDPLTAKEFKIILKDMAFTNDVPTQEILKAIRDVVAARLNNTASTSNVLKTGHDVLLLNIILSDMDLFYSKQKADPLRPALDNFLEWTRKGKKISSYIKNVFRSIEDTVSSAHVDLVLKLINEVKVFLEITVDPDTLR